MVASTEEMLASMATFSKQAKALRGRATILTGDAAMLDQAPLFKDECQRVSLVITSPPYPGVHVLYHRWQVDGRKETPAPFWIANRLDGSGESYYTLGHRKNSGLKTYFNNLEATLASTVALADDNTVFVQVVAFGSPDWQLPKYLEAARAAGLRERLLPGLDTLDGRLW